MKKSRKLAAGAALASALLVGGVAVPANAVVTTCPGVGGTWDYGVSSIVWSNFYHGSYLHRSTAGNSLGDWRSPNTQPGYWSKVSVGATAFNNRAYCARV